QQAYQASCPTVRSRLTRSRQKRKALGRVARGDERISRLTSSCAIHNEFAYQNHAHNPRSTQQFDLFDGSYGCYGLTTREALLVELTVKSNSREWYPRRGSHSVRLLNPQIHSRADLMSRPSSNASNISVLEVTNSSAPSIVPRTARDEKAAERPLEPIERISEVLFGLIMVLTITCSFSIAEADLKDIRTMLLGALGCNLAWSIIDGFMYLMACFSSRGQNIVALRAARNAPTPEEAHQIIANALP